MSVSTISGNVFLGLSDASIRIKRALGKSKKSICLIDDVSYTSVTVISLLGASDFSLAAGLFHGSRRINSSD